MQSARVARALGWLAFGSACAAPFAFGGVYRAFWIPVCEAWLVVGFVVSLLLWRGREFESTIGPVVVRAMRPIHFLFVLQLVPLPASALRLVSPGSYAAHFFPFPPDHAFRPLSVSPDATVEAWLYVAGLQGLLLALQGLPRSRHRSCLYAMLACVIALAAEGLWQSRSAHPYWPYGQVFVFLPSGLDNGVFGSYFNRNHFGTAVAMGAALAMGLATTLIPRAGLTALLQAPTDFARLVMLCGASGFLTLAAAASGSRSGTLAAFAAVGLVLGRAFGKRFVATAAILAGVAVLLTGAASVERLLRLDILESRVLPWLDISRLLRFFPLFGSGIGTLGAAYWPYQTNAAYEYWRHAHNDYLQWVVETGVVGILALLVAGRRLYRGLGFAAEVRNAGLGVVAAFATQAFLDFPSHVPANAGLLIVALGLTLTHGDPRPVPPSPLRAQP